MIYTFNQYISDTLNTTLHNTPESLRLWSEHGRTYLKHCRDQKMIPLDYGYKLTGLPTAFFTGAQGASKGWSKLDKTARSQRARTAVRARWAKIKQII